MAEPDFKLMFLYIQRPYSRYTATLPIIKGKYNSLEAAMAPHSSTLAWKIPWTEKPGRLQSMGLQRVGYD